MVKAKARVAWQMLCRDDCPDQGGGCSRRFLAESGQGHTIELPRRPISSSENILFTTELRT